MALERGYLTQSGKMLKTLWLLIIYILVLTLVKWIIGELFSSIALRADAISTLSDTIMAITALMSIYIILRSKPSRTTPYGLYKLEDLSTLGLTVTLFGISILIIMSGVSATLKGYTRNENFVLTSLVAFVSAIISIMIARKLRTISDELEMNILVLSAKDLKVDSYVSIIVGISIVADALSGAPLEGVVSILIGLVVMLMAILGGRRSILNLLDAWHDENLERKIIGIISEESKMLKVRRVRFRRAGSLVFCDVKLLAPEELRLDALDDILGRIESRIKREIDVIEDIIFEVEPLEEDIMICAIPITRRGSEIRIAESFEDSEEMAVFEVNLKTGQIKQLKPIKVPRAKNKWKKMVSLCKILISRDVDCVVARSISGITYELLKAYSIDTYIAETDNIEEALELLKKDELIYLEDYMVDQIQTDMGRQ